MEKWDFTVEKIGVRAEGCCTEGDPTLSRKQWLYIDEGLRWLLVMFVSSPWLRIESGQPSQRTIRTDCQPADGCLPLYYSNLEYILCMYIHVHTCTYM